jgi:predicted membrane-bound spermidine synthase
MRLVALLFAFSGLAGLVYESAWAGYLKLLAGHASYGQILSLCVFMGGLALGSHISARFVDRIRRPWTVYGAVEIAVGLGALAYHSAFVRLADWLWTSGVLEGRGVLAARLIVAAAGTAATLPWATLLGATFPLVAAGLLRRDPAGGHANLGVLYFANSLGGALGCVLNSFVLVPRLGLPGALQTAAAINLAVGAVFVAVSAREPVPDRIHPTGERSVAGNRAPHLIDLVAFLTGFSSFLYEIGWMRMLALQLGSSTHSFDIMLAAFLTGLAWGGWRARKGLERGRPRRLLARAQLGMAACAAGSLLAYQLFFEARNGMNLVLRTTPEAFPFAQIFKFASAFAMMGPAAFFAGTTLPLLASWHVRETGREEGLGRVYAWNTLGSLLGALGGGLFLLPAAGLQWVLVCGAAVDGALGFALLRTLRARWREVALAVVTVSVIVAAASVPLESDVMTRGSFRAHVTAKNQVVHRLDGSASTVSIHLRPNGYAILRNNGKPDASLSLVGDPGAGDNRTQGTIAWAPLSTRHRPYRAVLIGLGSGMTAHYLLGDPLLQSLDVVEIEPAVYRMSRYFAARNGRIFSDPRMHFWAEDARTFFATHGGKWDLVVSEPSNPWVSGVSSLFTREFYRDLKRHLAPDGALAQWLQSYEFRDELFLSILAAMRANFPKISLHPIPGTVADVMFLAGDSLPVPDPKRISSGTPYADLRAENLSPEDVATPPSATPRMIDLLVKGIVPNSDFAPVVDAGAEEAFFVKSRVTLPVLLAPRPSGWFRALDPAGWDTLSEPWERRWYRNVDTTQLAEFDAIARSHARSGVAITSRELALLDSLVPFPAWAEWSRRSPAIDDLRVAAAHSPALPEQDRLRLRHRFSLLEGDLEAAAEAAEGMLPSVRKDGRLFPEVFGTLWTAHRRAPLARLVADTASWAPLSWPEKLVVVQLQKTWGD